MATEIHNSATTWMNSYRSKCKERQTDNDTITTWRTKQEMPESTHSHGSECVGGCPTRGGRGTTRSWHVMCVNQQGRRDPDRGQEPTRGTRRKPTADEIFAAMLRMEILRVVLRSVADDERRQVDWSASPGRTSTPRSRGRCSLNYLRRRDWADESSAGCASACMAIASPRTWGIEALKALGFRRDRAIRCPFHHLYEECLPTGSRGRLLGHRFSEGLGVARAVNLGHLRGQGEEPARPTQRRGEGPEPDRRV